MTDDPLRHSRSALSTSRVAAADWPASTTRATAVRTTRRLRPRPSRPSHRAGLHPRAVPRRAHAHPRRHGRGVAARARSPSGRSTSPAPRCAPSSRSCIRACSRPRRPWRRPAAAVLLACPPEEGHDLGLRMVADRFDMAGWTTYFLGPDTPVEEIADAASGLGVDAVVMSSSTHYHRLAVRHAVDALKRELPGHRRLGGRPGLRRGRDRLAAARRSWTSTPS